MVALMKGVSYSVYIASLSGSDWKIVKDCVAEDSIEKPNTGGAFPSVRSSLLQSIEQNSELQQFCEEQLGASYSLPGIEAFYSHEVYGETKVKDTKQAVTVAVEDEETCKTAAAVTFEDKETCADDCFNAGIVSHDKKQTDATATASRHQLGSSPGASEREVQLAVAGHEAAGQPAPVGAPAHGPLKRPLPACFEIEDAETSLLEDVDLFECFATQAGTQAPVPRSGMLPSQSAGVGAGARGLQLGASDVGLCLSPGAASPDCTSSQDSLSFPHGVLKAFLPGAGKGTRLGGPNDAPHLSYKRSKPSPDDGLKGCSNAGGRAMHSLGSIHEKENWQDRYGVERQLEDARPHKRSKSALHALSANVPLYPQASRLKEARPGSIAGQPLAAAQLGLDGACKKQDGEHWGNTSLFFQTGRGRPVPVSCAALAKVTPLLGPLCGPMPVADGPQAGARNDALGVLGCRIGGASCQGLSSLASEPRPPADGVFPLPASIAEAQEKMLDLDRQTKLFDKLKALNDARKRGSVRSTSPLPTPSLVKGNEATPDVGSDRAAAAAPAPAPARCPEAGSMFQTASGKRVTVSLAAMNRMRSFLHDEIDGIGEEQPPWGHKGLLPHGEGREVTAGPAAASEGARPEGEHDGWQKDSLEKRNVTAPEVPTGTPPMRSSSQSKEPAVRHMPAVDRREALHALPDSAPERPTGVANHEGDGSNERQGRGCTRDKAFWDAAQLAGWGGALCMGDQFEDDDDAMFQAGSEGQGAGGRKSGAIPAGGFGFPTGRGAVVKVRAHSHRKALALFGEAEACNQPADRGNEGVAFVGLQVAEMGVGTDDSVGMGPRDGSGFQTARGGKVKVSAASRRFALTLLGDIEEDYQPAEENHADVRSHKQPGWVEPGEGTCASSNGQTAGRSAPSFSADSHGKALEPHRELGAGHQPASKDNETVVQGQHMIGWGGQRNAFQAAGGGAVSFSTDSYRKALVLYAEPEAGNQPAGGGSEGARLGAQASGGSGFQTARGGAVSFRAASLRKAATLLGKLSDDAGLPQATATHEAHELSVVQGQAGVGVVAEGLGFSSRSGQAGRGPQATATRETHELSAVQGQAGARAVVEAASSWGFQTASGRAVAFAADSYRNAQALFGELLEGGEGVAGVPGGRLVEPSGALRSMQGAGAGPAVPAANGSSGFETAGGRAVSINPASRKWALGFLGELSDNGAKVPAGGAHAISPFDSQGSARLGADASGGRGPPHNGPGYAAPNAPTQANGNGEAGGADGYEQAPPADAQGLLEFGGDLGVNGGFQAGRGRRIDVSPALLRKAEALFNSEMQTGLHGSPAGGLQAAASRVSETSAGKPMLPLQTMHALPVNPSCPLALGGVQGRRQLSPPQAHTPFPSLASLSLTTPSSEPHQPQTPAVAAEMVERAEWAVAGLWDLGSNEGAAEPGQRPFPANCGQVAPHKGLLLVGGASGAALPAPDPVRMLQSPYGAGRRQLEAQGAGMAALGGFRSPSPQLKTPAMRKGQKFRFSTPRSFPPAPSLHPEPRGGGGFVPPFFSPPPGGTLLHSTRLPDSTPAPPGALYGSPGGASSATERRGKPSRFDVLPPIPMQPLGQVAGFSTGGKLHDLYAGQARPELAEFLGGPPGLVWKQARVLPVAVRRMTSTSAALHVFDRQETGALVSTSLAPPEARALLLTAGADPKAVTAGWVENHYRWVVWKLACYERCYPVRLAHKLLTPARVLDELKYRYERETNWGSRSAIRMISEQDAAASRPMVLCVSAIVDVGSTADDVAAAAAAAASTKAGIVEGKECEGLQEEVEEGEESGAGGRAGSGTGARKTGGAAAARHSKGAAPEGRPAVVELTDGWYWLKAQLDNELSAHVRDGSIFVGQKLQVWGAVLKGSTDGLPPLEACKVSYLGLNANGTRRAHWAARLGFCRKRPAPLAFRCIKPSGGDVPITCLVVARVYPMLYRERLPDGTGIVRTGRAEAVAARLYEERRTRIGEETALRLERDNGGGDGSHGCLPCAASRVARRNFGSEGARLMAALEGSDDPESLLADFTPAQHTAIASFQALQEEASRAAIEKEVDDALKAANLTERDVSPLLKLRVAGLRSLNTPPPGVKGKGKAGGRWALEDEDTKEEEEVAERDGLVTLWRPSEEQLQHIVEEGVYLVSNLQPVKPVPGSSSSSSSSRTVLFNTSRSTMWHLLLPHARQHLLHTHPPRCAVQLLALAEVPIGREFDVAALVLSVGEPQPHGMRAAQWLFLTDGTAFDHGNSEHVSGNIDSQNNHDSASNNNSGIGNGNGNSPQARGGYNGRNHFESGPRRRRPQAPALLAVQFTGYSDTFVALEPSLCGSVVTWCNLVRKKSDDQNGLLTAEAPDTAHLSGASTCTGCSSTKHLRDAVAAVSQWAHDHPQAVSALQERVYKITGSALPTPGNRPSGVVRRAGMTSPHLRSPRTNQPLITSFLHRSGGSNSFPSKPTPALNPQGQLRLQFGPRNRWPRVG